MPRPKALKDFSRIDTRENITDFLSDIPPYEESEPYTESQKTLRLESSEVESNGKLQNILQEEGYEDEDDDEVIGLFGKVIKPRDTNSSHSRIYQTIENQEDQEDQEDQVDVIDKLNRIKPIRTLYTNERLRRKVHKDVANARLDVDVGRLVGVSPFVVDQGGNFSQELDEHASSKTNHRPRTFLDATYFGLRFDLNIGPKFLRPHYVIMSKGLKTSEKGERTMQFKIYRHSIPVFVPIKRLEEMYLNRNINMFIQKLRQYLINLSVRQHIFDRSLFTNQGSDKDSQDQGDQNDQNDQDDEETINTDKPPKWVCDLPHVTDVCSNPSFDHITLTFEGKDLEFTQLIKRPARNQARSNRTHHQDTYESEQVRVLNRRIERTLDLVISPSTNKVISARLRPPFLHREPDIELLSFLNSRTVDVKLVHRRIRRWWASVYGK